MRYFLDNLISRDENIEAICSFILKSTPTSVPVATVEKNYYTSEELGRLGEQYIKYLFQGLDITKMPAYKKRPSPDFRITLGNRNYLLEVKIVKFLYKDVYQILYEIGRREDREFLYRKLERLVKSCRVKISPPRIHFLDEKKLKNKIRRLLSKIHFPLVLEIRKNLEAPSRRYFLEIEPALRTPKVIWPPENSISLGMILSRKRKQIGSSDILTVILLNKAKKQEIKEFLYPSINAKSFRRETLGSIWDLEYETDLGKVIKIKKKLKAILFLLPYDKKCFIAYPFRRKFSAGMRYLEKYLQEKGYRYLPIFPQ